MRLPPLALLLPGLLSSSLAFTLVPPASAAEMKSIVFIGTYTGGKSKGIYSCRFDSAAGKLSQPALAVETRNPSFLVVHPNGQWLFAVSEVSEFDGARSGAVEAFQIDKESGRLTLLNAQPSGGTGPCHLALDGSGRCLLVANYNSGSLAAFPVQADGRLGKQSASIQHRGSSANPERQEGPHAHFIRPDPANRFALACDLGLDKVFVYKLDPDRALLSPNQPPYILIKPGSGPRHLVFAPNGHRVYVINEMGSSLTALEYLPEQGALKELQTISTLPREFHGQNTCAEVQIHPSGKLLFASNRGHNSIAIYRIGQSSGRLTYLGAEDSGGKTPRHFVLDPAGHWLIAENQDSDNLVVFRVDAKAGKLVPTSESVGLGAPVCAAFMP